MTNFKESFLLNPPFTECKSFKKLQSLPPFELHRPQAVTEERITSMVSNGAGLSILYGFQRITREIFTTFQELADERGVVAKMESLFRGDPINFIEGYPSENRKVLHPVARDLFEPYLTGDVAARRSVEDEVQKLRLFMDSIEGKFDEMLFIGIGGSLLGPEALAEALGPMKRKDRKVFYAGNVDPDEMTEALLELNMKKALVVIVSKSGTTLETATNEARARDHFEKAGLDPKEHFVAITMPKTPLDDLRRYREVFHLFDFIGGRFSSTSMVGGVLLSFLSSVTTFTEILEGANEIDRLALRSNIRDNLPLLLALLGIYNRNVLGYSTHAVIPYSYSLRLFPEHLQQCEMESNGKRILRNGKEVSFQTCPIVWGHAGTNAQHSFFQLLHQGTSVVPLDFIGFREPEWQTDFTYKDTTSQEKLVANLFAQSYALATGKEDQNPNKSFPGNRPSTIILSKRLTPKVLGALLALYEHKVAFEGFLWGINSFDQEGVQLGKNLATKMLSIMQGEKEGPVDFPVGRALYAILQDLSGRNI